MRVLLRWLGRPEVTPWLVGLGWFLVVVLWGRLVLFVYGETGAFVWLGADFSTVYSQARALQEFGTSAIYDRQLVSGLFQNLIRQFGAPGTHGYEIDPPAYPPLLPFLYTAVLGLPAPRALAVFLSISAGLTALFVGFSVRWLPEGRRAWLALALGASFPVAYGVVLAQIQPLITLCFTLFFLGLRAGRRFLAGLALGVACMKPQYGAPLLLLLLWKRDWRTIAGAAVSVGAVGCLSLATTSLGAVVGYLQSFLLFGGFRADTPTHMVNFRGLVLTLVPQIDDRSGRLIELLLGAIAVVGAVWTMRGPWRPRDPDFGTRLAAFVIAFMLASHHSHSYGVSMLVPLVADIARRGMSRVAWVMVVGVFGIPSLIFLGPFLGSVTRASFATIVALALSMILLVVRGEAEREAGALSNP